MRWRPDSGPPFKEGFSGQLIQNFQVESFLTHCFPYLFDKISIRQGLNILFRPFFCAILNVVYIFFYEIVWLSECVGFDWA